MSDYMEYAEYYKKAWEKSLSERTSELQAEIDRLTKALENIASGDIPMDKPSQHISATRWYEDYADSILRGVR